MPRVPLTAYCERRNKLRQLWKADHGNLLGLSATEQWALHEYYRFAEDLTQNQVREHWNQQHAKRSSLSQRAGRGYAAFESIIKAKHLVKAQPRPKSKKLGKVKVDSVVLPQPDVKKLAKTLVDLASEDLRRSRLP